jgi:hypothetical protein
VALLYPLTECTKTLSVASTASSMNSKIALEASSFTSNTIYYTVKISCKVLDYPDLARKM